MHLGSFPGSTGDADGTEDVQGMAAAFKKNMGLLCASEPRFSMYEDVDIGNQVRTFIDLPQGEFNSTGYSDLVLGQNNWGYGAKPAAGKLPLNLDGKTPKIQCVEEDCPPRGPSYNQSLPVQSETRRSLRDRPRWHRTVNRRDQVIADVKKRQTVHADRLIVTNIAQHSAIELCNSPYSLGPDMVSLSESMFCDMSEKRLWPICTDSSATYCFDMDAQIVRGSPSTVQGSDTPLYPNTTLALTGSTLVAGGSGLSTSAVPSKSYTRVSTGDP